jgi:hypothetical protein
MTNVPGSKPTIVPAGSQVQMANPWAPGQPAWIGGQASDGGIIGGTPLPPKLTQPSWRRPPIPAGILSPMMLPGMQAQIAQPATSPVAPTAAAPAPGASGSGGTPATQPSPRTPQQEMDDLLALIAGGYNAM